MMTNLTNLYLVQKNKNHKPLPIIKILCAHWSISEYCGVACFPKFKVWIHQGSVVELVINLTR